ncbi:DUF2188 domain-containing protein [Micromonospora sp. DT81.3]|uniref:DUF2188 domain-containing protein n=1 Tax=Micromonospora sp. DT81.3 TaxID=3416523 RepID=UPI003CE8704B
MSGRRATILPLGSRWAVLAGFSQNLTEYGTEAEAIDAVRSALSAIGGGELLVKDRTGAIIYSEVFPPH